MNIYATIYFRNWRSAVSLCHRNRTKVTVLVCEQKPYPRPIQFDFCGVAKAIQCSVNGKPSLSKIPPHSTTHKAGFQCKLGTLSEDNDDNSENVYEKINLRSFKLNRVYLDPLDMSNAGDVSWR